MSGLGWGAMMREGERASGAGRADFCTWLHSFIRKWPRVKFKDGRAGSEIRKRRRIRQLTLLGEWDQWDNHSSANLMLPPLSQHFQTGLIGRNGFIGCVVCTAGFPFVCDIPNTPTRSDSRRDGKYLLGLSDRKASLKDRLLRYAIDGAAWWQDSGHGSLE